MTTPANKAAYLYGKGQKLVVEDAPYYSPGADQVTIRVHAIALNPVDAGLQQLGIFIKQWPHVLGCDGAGTVEEVGQNVHHVKKGDRVYAICSGKFGNDGYENSKGFGSFQLYTLADAYRVGRLPDSISFEAGSVFALTTMTSTIGLFGNEKDRNFLGLDRPTLASEPKDEYLFVWGGSSSVGMCAIQLAKAAGYRVVTSCSEHNFDLCKDIGAEETFDHKKANVEDKILERLRGKKLAGIFDSISRYGTIERCTQLARRTEGPRKVVFVSPEALKDRPDDIVSDAVFGTPSGDTLALLRFMFTEFLPAALEAGIFRAGKPEPEVVGHGLEHTQEANERMAKGVSGKKLVVTL